MRSVGVRFAIFAWLVQACSGGGGEPLGAAGERHLIYLHGRIVQEAQRARPRHPELGFYELEEILAAFREGGFVVDGEIRPRDESVDVAAGRVVERVQELMDAGVPPGRITVVGASMGAGIALRASARLGEPELRYAVLGTCLTVNVRRLSRFEDLPPSGHVLAIRERSDETTARCPRWSGEPELAPQLVAEEIEIDTGLRHGFLYRPLREWLEPVVRWSRGAPPTEGAEATGGKEIR